MNGDYDPRVDSLKPCPFCGSDDLSIFISGTGTYYVLCECGAGGPVAENDMLAVVAWNERTPLVKADYITGRE